MPDRFAASLIPVHRRVDSAKLESFGSGTLVEFENRFLLISAAHVLLEPQLFLPGKPVFVEVRYGGGITATSDTKMVAENDPIDVAYMTLKPHAVDFLKNDGHAFLPIQRTSFERDLSEPRRFCFSGFPVSRSRTRVGAGIIHSSRMDAHGEAVPDDEMDAIGCDPRKHVGMRYPREKMFHEGKVPVTAPLPAGMSGGAVWQMIDDEIVLVAVATDYLQQHEILRGTRINPVFHRVRQQAQTA